MFQFTSDLGLDVSEVIIRCSKSGISIARIHSREIEVTIQYTTNLNDTPLKGLISDKVRASRITMAKFAREIFTISAHLIEILPLFFASLTVENYIKKAHEVIG